MTKLQTDLAHTYRELFSRAKVLSEALLNAQGDIKQCREDMVEQLCTPDVPEIEARKIKAEIREVIALAMIEAKDARAAAAAKIELRERVAAMLDLQLSLDV